MGMPYRLYWDGEAEAAKYYREADKIKQDRVNEQTWLQGLYVYDVIASLQPSLNPFAKGRPKDYLPKPLELRAKTKPKSKREEDKRIDAGRSFFEALAVSVNKKFQQEGGDVDAARSGRS